MCNADMQALREEIRTQGEGRPLEEGCVVRRSFTEKESLVPTCPDCGSRAVKRSSSYVYGRDYGRELYVCPNFPRCDCYVGTHPDGSPVGTMANAALRKARKDAHAAFDPLWKARLMSRREAYQWLAEALDLSADETHIGMFDEEQCREVAFLAIRKRNALT